MIFGAVAGAFIGGLAGLEVGMLSGSFDSVLVKIGLPEEDVGYYEKYLKEGKLLVMVKGSLEEDEKAKQILKSDDSFSEMK